jgi:hypothetical protein
LRSSSSSDIASSINIYKSVWAAKATVSGTTLESLSLADQLKVGRSWGRESNPLPSLVLQTKALPFGYPSFQTALSDDDGKNLGAFVVPYRPVSQKREPQQQSPEAWQHHRNELGIRVRR